MRASVLAAALAACLLASGVGALFLRGNVFSEFVQDSELKLPSQWHQAIVMGPNDYQVIEPVFNQTLRSMPDEIQLNIPHTVVVRTANTPMFVVHELPDWFGTNTSIVVQFGARFVGGRHKLTTEGHAFVKLIAKDEGLLQEELNPLTVAELSFGVVNSDEGMYMILEFNDQTGAVSPLVPLDNRPHIFTAEIIPEQNVFNMLMDGEVLQTGKLTELYLMRLCGLHARIAEYFIDHSFFQPERKSYPTIQRKAPVGWREDLTTFFFNRTSRREELDMNCIRADCGKIKPAINYTVVPDYFFYGPVMPMCRLPTSQRQTHGDGKSAIRPVDQVAVEVLTAGTPVQWGGLWIGVEPATAEYLRSQHWAWGLDWSEDAADEIDAFETVGSSADYRRGLKVNAVHDAQAGTPPVAATASTPEQQSGPTPGGALGRIHGTVSAARARAFQWLATSAPAPVREAVQAAAFAYRDDPEMCRLLAAAALALASFVAMLVALVRRCCGRRR